MTLDIEWLNNSRKSLNDLYKSSTDNDEICIAEYVLTVYRLLNGLYSMHDESLYRYEQLILYRPMKIFVEHFIEETKETLGITNQKDVQIKRDYIKDLEEAVVRVVETYEHITDSMANSDRRTFTGFAVDTNLYDLSPKLTAFYAYVINETIELFDEQGSYGCFLHPSIRHNIESCLLFGKRNKGGRVIVANIPESMLEEIPEVTVSLLHEVFHIITRKQRHRKKRAEIMIDTMNQFLKQKLFESEGLKTDDKFCEKVFKNLNELKQAITKGKEEETGHDIYYGTEFLQNLTEACKKDLFEFYNQYERIIFEATDGIMPEHVKEELALSEQLYLDLLQSPGRIRAGIMELFLNSVIDKAAEQLLELFRETYADVALFSSLEIKPDYYFSAFDKSISFIPKSYNDSFLSIRKELVVEVMWNVSDRYKNEWGNRKEDPKDDQNNLWKSVSEYFEGEKPDENDKDKQEQVLNELRKMLNNPQPEDNKRKENNDESLCIQYDKEMKEQFSKYLLTCAKDIKKCVKKRRGKIKVIEDINNQSRAEMIKSILSIPYQYC